MSINFRKHLLRVRWRHLIWKSFEFLTTNFVKLNKLIIIFSTTTVIHCLFSRSYSFRIHVMYVRFGICTLYSHTKFSIAQELRWSFCFSLMLFLFRSNKIVSKRNLHHFHITSSLANWSRSPLPHQKLTALNLFLLFELL